jgi:hypothetical protein
MPEATPSPPQAPPPKSSSPITEPAAIFIAAATLFAIFINSQNVGPILMLGVIALLLETRLRPKD